MKLTQLSRNSGETIQWSALQVRFPPELWNATTPYRERREGAGLCRLGVRTVLALVGEWDVESAVEDRVVHARGHLLGGHAARDDGLEQQAHLV